MVQSNQSNMLKHFIVCILVFLLSLGQPLATYAATSASPNEGRIDIVLERGDAQSAYMVMGHTDFKSLSFQLLLAAAMAYFGAASSIGEASTAVANAMTTANTVANTIVKLAVQAVLTGLMQGAVQGLTSVAQGKKFMDGFEKGFVTGFFSGLAAGIADGLIQGYSLGAGMSFLVETGSGMAVGALQGACLAALEDDGDVGQGAMLGFVTGGAMGAARGGGRALGMDMTSSSGQLLAGLSGGAIGGLAYGFAYADEDEGFNKWAAFGGALAGAQEGVAGFRKGQIQAATNIRFAAAESGRAQVAEKAAKAREMQANCGRAGCEAQGIDPKTVKITAPTPEEAVAAFDAEIRYGRPASAMTNLERDQAKVKSAGEYTIGLMTGKLGEVAGYAADYHYSQEVRDARLAMKEYVFNWTREGDTENNKLVRQNASDSLSVKLESIGQEKERVKATTSALVSGLFAGAMISAGKQYEDDYQRTNRTSSGSEFMLTSTTAYETAKVAGSAVAQAYGGVLAKQSLTDSTLSRDMRRLQRDKETGKITYNDYLRQKQKIENKMQDNAFVANEVGTQVGMVLGGGVKAGFEEMHKLAMSTPPLFSQEKLEKAQALFKKMDDTQSDINNTQNEIDALRLDVSILEGEKLPEGTSLSGKCLDVNECKTMLASKEIAVRVWSGEATNVSSELSSLGSDTAALRQAVDLNQRVVNAPHIRARAVSGSVDKLAQAQGQGAQAEKIVLVNQNEIERLNTIERTDRPSDFVEKKKAKDGLVKEREQAIADPKVQGAIALGQQAQEAQSQGQTWNQDLPNMASADGKVSYSYQYVDPKGAIVAAKDAPKIEGVQYKYVGVGVSDGKVVDSNPSAAPAREYQYEFVDQDGKAVVGSDGTKLVATESQLASLGVQVTAGATSMNIGAPKVGELTSNQASLSGFAKTTAASVLNPTNVSNVAGDVAQHAMQVGFRREYTENNTDRSKYLKDAVSTTVGGVVRGGVRDALYLADASDHSIPGMYVDEQSHAQYRADVVLPTRERIAQERFISGAEAGGKLVLKIDPAEHAVLAQSDDQIEARAAELERGQNGATPVILKKNKETALAMREFVALRKKNAETDGAARLFVDSSIRQAAKSKAGTAAVLYGKNSDATVSAVLASGSKEETKKLASSADAGVRKAFVEDKVANEMGRLAENGRWMPGATQEGRAAQIGLAMQGNTGGALGADGVQLAEEHRKAQGAVVEDMSNRKIRKLTEETFETDIAKGLTAQDPQASTRVSMGAVFGRTLVKTTENSIGTGVAQVVQGAVTNDIYTGMHVYDKGNVTYQESPGKTNAASNYMYNMVAAPAVNAAAGLTAAYFSDGGKGLDAKAFSKAAHETNVDNIALLSKLEQKNNTAVPVTTTGEIVLAKVGSADKVDDFRTNEDILDKDRKNLEKYTAQKKAFSDGTANTNGNGGGNCTSEKDCDDAIRETKGLIETRSKNFRTEKEDAYSSRYYTDQSKTKLSATHSREALMLDGGKETYSGQALSAVQGVATAVQGAHQDMLESIVDTGYRGADMSQTQFNSFAATAGERGREKIAALTSNDQLSTGVVQGYEKDIGSRHTMGAMTSMAPVAGAFGMRQNMMKFVTDEGGFIRSGNEKFVQVASSQEIADALSEAKAKTKKDLAEQFGIVEFSGAEIAKVLDTGLLTDLAEAISADGRRVSAKELDAEIENQGGIEKFAQNLEATGGKNTRKILQSYGSQDGSPVLGTRINEVYVREKDRSNRFAQNLAAVGAVRYELNDGQKRALIAEVYGKSLDDETTKKMLVNWDATSRDVDQVLSDRYRGKGEQSVQIGSGADSVRYMQRELPDTIWMSRNTLQAGAPEMRATDASGTFRPQERSYRDMDLNKRGDSGAARVMESGRMSSDPTQRIAPVASPTSAAATPPVSVKDDHSMDQKAADIVGTSGWLKAVPAPEAKPVYGPQEKKSDVGKTEDPKAVKPTPNTSGDY